MCIIAIKTPGTKMPNEATIRTMWTRNPHGAGFMYASNGVVHIRKGFDDVETFMTELSRIPSPKKTPVIMHFRIATHGGIRPGNTHPFPILHDVDKLSALNFYTRSVCVAHNGVLPIQPGRSDISDTMEFVANRLAYIQDMNPEFMYSEPAMQLIAEMSEGSRLAFLNGAGDIRTTGYWYEDQKTGIIFSNTSFVQPYKWAAPKKNDRLEFPELPDTWERDVRASWES